MIGRFHDQGYKAYNSRPRPLDIGYVTFSKSANNKLIVKLRCNNDLKKSSHFLYHLFSISSRDNFWAHFLKSIGRYNEDWQWKRIDFYSGRQSRQSLYRTRMSSIPSLSSVSRSSWSPFDNASFGTFCIRKGKKTSRIESLKSSLKSTLTLLTQNPSEYSRIFYGGKSKE